LTLKGGVFTTPVPEYEKTVVGIDSLKKMLTDLSEVIVTVLVVDVEASSSVPLQRSTCQPAAGLAVRGITSPSFLVELLGEGEIVPPIVGLGVWIINIWVRLWKETFTNLSEVIITVLVFDIEESSAVPFQPSTCHPAVGVATRVRTAFLAYLPFEFGVGLTEIVPPGTLTMDECT